MTAQEMIGRKIACLFTCFDYLKEYDCTVQSLFVQFDSGEVLSIPNEDEEPRIPSKDENLVPFAQGQCCEGETIIDVLDSFLPNYSLLLSNNKLIFGDSSAPNEFNWYIDDFSEDLRAQNEFKSIRKEERNISHGSIR